jgi:hypothetical protein
MSNHSTHDDDSPAGNPPRLRDPITVIGVHTDAAESEFVKVELTLEPS